MFSEKKSSDQVLERNIIGKNTSINGDISSEGDFRIDGLVEGSIKTSGKVIVGKDGRIEGTVECTQADIEGSFNGKLIVSDMLFLKSSAIVKGEVFINRLSVEPGATFNATCAMKSGVKELNKNEAKKAEKLA